MTRCVDGTKGWVTQAFQEKHPDCAPSITEDSVCRRGGAITKGRGEASLERAGARGADARKEEKGGG